MPQDRFVTRVVALAVSAVLGYVLYLIFRPFIGSIVWALLLAYLLFPLVMRLRRRLGAHTIQFGSGAGAGSAARRRTG